MRYTEIETRSRLKKQTLDPYHYTLSLLQEGYRAGLISQAGLDDIQLQIMSLLRESIIKYTRAESSSVKVETAQSIMLSNLYAMDAYLHRFTNPEEAVAVLIETSIEEIYIEGLEVVRACFEESQQLHREVQNSKLSVPNQAYHATIEEALPDFFRKYDPVFGAHQTMASMDYPLLFDDMRITGIFYIQQYLEKLALENQLSRLFPEKEIEKLFFNYGRVYRIDCREALINIFEVVITNAIFSVGLDNSSPKLNISRFEYQTLLEKFRVLEPAACTAFINEAVASLTAVLHIEDLRLSDYIANVQSVLIPRFLTALEHDCLENVIILDEAHQPGLEIVFNEGQRIDDERFCGIVDEILDCDNGAQKTALINTGIQSLGDFIDILEAECLFGEEFKELFAVLGDMELSILARIVFIEELRNEPGGFSFASWEEKPLDNEWQIELVDYLHSLNRDRLKNIENYLSSSFQENSNTGILG